MTNPIPTAEVAKVRREASSLTAPVLNTANAITIKDSITYGNADEILKRIREARRGVTEKFEPIIRPLRSGLEMLYKFRGELEDPLELAEKHVKGKMAAWQLAERKRIEQETKEREREALKLRKQLDDKTAKAALATRQSVKTALSNATTEIAQQLADVESQPVSTATRGEHSRTRTVKKCGVTNLWALLKAVLDGEVPFDLIQYDQVKLNSYFRDSPETVASWPGVKITEDIQIVGR